MSDDHADSRRISLELSHSWPGEMYLRFGTAHGPAVMVGVTDADLAGLRRLLGCPHEGAEKEYERLLERRKSYEAHCRALPRQTPHTAPGYPTAYDLQREGHFLEQAIPLLEGLVKVRAAVYADAPDYRADQKP